MSCHMIGVLRNNLNTERGFAMSWVILVSIMVVFAVMAAAQFLDIGQETISHIDSAVDDGSLFTPASTTTTI